MLHAPCAMLYKRREKCLSKNIDVENVEKFLRRFRKSMKEENI
jgi:hypothetical protein